VQAQAESSTFFLVLPLIFAFACVEQKRSRAEAHPKRYVCPAKNTHSRFRPQRGFPQTTKMAERGCSIFDKRFAKMVHNHRLLFDKECKDFKDRNKKLQA